MPQNLMNQDQAIAVSVTLTREAHDKFSQQVSSLNHRLAHMGEDLQGLAGGSWARVMQAWNEQVTKLLSSLHEFGENLEGTDRTFQITDSEAEQALSRLTARLG